MILNSITIENIRSYSHEEVIFPRGISLFEGDIGSGKSTILMAIEFALFGLGSQKAESLLAKKSESGFVILDFSVDGEKYEIKRTLQRKKSRVNQDPKNSWIRIGDEISPLSPSELKQQILKILRFNEPADPKAESKIFRYAIFTPQESMKEVLSDSSKRLETIRKAFGIEDYSTAKSNSLEVLSELRSRGAVLQDRFSNISELESNSLESHKRIKELDASIAGISNAIKKKKIEEKETLTKIKELQEKNNKVIRLKSKKESLVVKGDTVRKQSLRIESDIKEFESELVQNNQSVEKLGKIKKPETRLTRTDITSEIKKFQKINDDLVAYGSEKKSISQDILKLKDELGDKINADKNAYESALNNLQEEEKSLVECLEKITEKIDKVKSQKVEKSTLKSNLEGEIAKFEKLGNSCPVCKQKISEEHHHALVGKKQSELNELNGELKKSEERWSFNLNQKVETEDKLKANSTEINQIQQIIPRMEELASKTSRLAEIDSKIREIRHAEGKEYGEDPIGFLTHLKDRVVDFENAAEKRKQALESSSKIDQKVSQRKTELEKLKNEIIQNEAELADTEKLLKSYEDVEEIISGLESKQNEIREDIRKMSMQLAASNERKDSEQEKITEIQKDISESKKWQKKFKILSEFRGWLEEFFIPAISQIEKQVLLSILHNFNETYTGWYSILVEDPTKESRIDEDFTPIVNQDGFEQEVGYLSGGEKTSIALAYRLTLNSLMRKEAETMKSSLLILDEPTDGFSKNQLSKIRDLFDELKSEQIVLVSHEKELETYVDNVFQISKNDGISKISRLN